ncbi:dipeptide/oligopeptide/nickel ABC transporter ATP-binding protein [Clostridiaceae bacterium M8S5]|nr:dipeptide/oligopeptide/nickel ABC transporter ATP-binding protein [Clostridiaceae bacterium M8S5]
MLSLKNVDKHYSRKDKKGKKTIIKAVENVSLTIRENKSYSLVGESGSGKSTLARLMAFIESPTKGQIMIDNQDLSKLNKEQLRLKRVDIQMVMQDGQSSLDPRVKIYDSIAEPIRNFEKTNKKDERLRVESLVNKVELSMDILDRLPHELSGGEQKRVCIARAISINPRLIIFDEAVSGLDVTVRKKVLNLLLKLRSEIKSSYLFITHDIDVALYMSKDISVMKDGKIVEKIENIKSLRDFKHDYSKILINALPPKVPRSKTRK